MQCGCSKKIKVEFSCETNKSLGLMNRRLRKTRVNKEVARGSGLCCYGTVYMNLVLSQ